MSAPSTCPACTQPVVAGAPAVQCPRCGLLYHVECWSRSRGCGWCRPASEQAAEATPPEPVLRITTDEVRAAAPLPARLPPPAPPVPASERERDGEPLALAALVLGLVGLLPGLALLTGLPAIVCGLLGLSRQRRVPESRLGWMAGVGLLAGTLTLLATVLAAFLVGLPRLQEHQGAPTPIETKADLTYVREPIRTALAANVFIGGVGGGGSWVGSGVVVRRAADGIYVLTNHHVVDPRFSEHGRAEPPSAQVSVCFYTGERAPGQAVWVAPHGVDLAVLRCAGRVTAPELGVSALDAATDADLAPGEDVFAIGNPEGLSWSYTRGALSAVRRTELNGFDTELVQTDTPINQGNSGGGLYAQSGRLIGINSLTEDKSKAEGLSFAISIRTIRQVLSESGFVLPPPA